MQEKKIRVLTVNWSIEEGSIAKIIEDIESVNAETCEFYHCYQVGEKSNHNKYRVAGWNLTRFYYLWARVCGIKYGVGTLPTVQMLFWIKKIRPDVVHIHCPNFYNINLYILFRYLKKKNYAVVITNHAEFFYTGNCAHAEECEGYFQGCVNCKKVFDTTHPYLQNRTHTEWKRMKKAFENFPKLKMVAVSAWVKERCQKAPITSEIPVRVIENAIDETVFYKREPLSTKWKEKRVADKKLILNVTSGFSDKKEDLKGGIYLIELAKRMPECIFWVAGNIYLDSPESIPDNMVLLGNIADKNDLAELYLCADLTVLTSKRETYGMVCAESLACGTPVVAFEAGGTESIAIKQYTEFVKYGNVDQLKDAVCRWMERKADISGQLAAVAKVRYARKRMGEEYMQLYRELLEEA